MSSDIKQGWEPSDESVKQALLAQSRNSDRSHRYAMYEAISAAVATDPLLSAAKEMQDALDDLTKAVRAVFGDKWTDTLFSDVLPVADAALRKSRGE